MRGVLVILVVFVALLAMRRERFQSPEVSAVAASAVRDMVDGKVKAAPGSVLRVALTSVETAPAKNSGVVSQMINGTPAFSVLLRARPKYVTSAFNVIGTPFTVEGTGATKAAAESDALIRVQAALAEITSVLRGRGIIA